MKTIGLLGGTSWPSTPLYYKFLNERAHEKYGGFHSASIILKSIDYHELRSRYEMPNGWSEIPAILKQNLDSLVSYNPDCIVICNNTLHKAVDAMDYKPQGDIPLFHAVDETAKVMNAAGINSALFMATAFTMRDGFFVEKLKRFNIEAFLPDADEQKQIGAIQLRLAKGESSLQFTEYFQKVIKKHNPSSVILACTELPLALAPEQIDIPLFNSINCQCLAAAQFAFT